jgi:raffinose/stachyose/melibiose transport system substrate-binding protein
MKNYFKPVVFLAAIICFILAIVVKFQLHKADFWVLADNDEVEKQEPVVIHFIHWVNFPKEIFNKFSDRYPNIKVEFEQYDMSQYRDAQRARILTGENIDIMGVVDKDYRNYVNKRYLEDLTYKSFLGSYVEESVRALKEISPNERIYAVPYKSWVLGIWYNKILFNKYGVDVPKNYEEFLNVCKKLKRNGVTPMVLGARDDDISGYLYYMNIWSVGEKDKEWFEKLDEKKTKWTDREMEKVFTRAETFVKNHYLSDEAINLTYHQAFSSFVNGQAAMCLMGDWSIDMYEPGNEKVCDFGVFPIPYNEPGEEMRIPGTRAGHLMGVFSQSKNKKEAELLLEFISKAEVAQIYVDNAYSTCNIKGINTEKLKLNNLWDPLIKRELTPPITSMIDFDVQERLNKSAKQIIIGTKTADTVLKELQDFQEKRK